MFLLMNFIMIAATLFVSGQDPGILKMGDDAHCRTFRNPNLVSHITHARTGAFRQAKQSMRMIAKEVPRRSRLGHGAIFIGNEIQETKSMIY